MTRSCFDASLQNQDQRARGPCRLKGSSQSLRPRGLTRCLPCPQLVPRAPKHETSGSSLAGSQRCFLGASAQEALRPGPTTTRPGLVTYHLNGLHRLQRAIPRLDRRRPRSTLAPRRYRLLQPHVPRARTRQGHDKQVAAAASSLSEDCLHPGLHEREQTERRSMRSQVLPEVCGRARSRPAPCSGSRAPAGHTASASSAAATPTIAVNCSSSRRW